MNKRIQIYITRPSGGTKHIVKWPSSCRRPCLCVHIYALGSTFRLNSVHMHYHAHVTLSRAWQNISHRLAARQIPNENTTVHPAAWRSVCDGRERGVEIRRWIVCGLTQPQLTHVTQHITLMENATRELAWPGRHKVDSMLNNWIKFPESDEHIFRCSRSNRTNSFARQQTHTLY